MSDTSDPELRKEDALDQLRTFRRWHANRDLLVCNARRAGASWDEILAESGIARGTVRSILDRAGLTGDQPQLKEDTMVPLSLPTDYRHYSNFVSVAPATDADRDKIGYRYLNIEAVDPPIRVLFHFRAFTGHERQPEAPRLTDEERTGSLNDRLRGAMRDAEYDVALDAWKIASYTSDMESLLRDAATTWPAYSEALSDLDKRYAELATTPDAEWREAVFRLFEAQDRALSVASEWDQLGRSIDRLADKRPFRAPHYVDLARQLGLTDQMPSWDFYSATHSDVQVTIAQQKRRLEEIAAVSPQLPAATTD